MIALVWKLANNVRYLGVRPYTQRPKVIHPPAVVRQVRWSGYGWEGICPLGAAISVGEEDKAQFPELLRFSWHQSHHGSQLMEPGRCTGVTNEAPCKLIIQIEDVGVGGTWFLDGLYQRRTSV